MKPLTDLPPILEDITSLQEVLEKLPQGIMIFKDMKLVFTNSAEAELLGYPVSELIGLSFEDTLRMIHPEDQESIIEAAKTMQEGSNVTWHDRVRLVRKDGKIIPIDNYGRNIMIQGEPVIMVINVDISKRISAEKALAESERQYRSLFEKTPTGIAITNKEGNFLAVNNTFLQETLYTHDDIQNLKAASMYANPDNRKRYLTLLEEMGTVKDYEVDIKRKDGTTFLALLNADPFRFDGKDVFLTTIRNISTLKETQETNRNIVRSIPIGLHMYELDDSGTLIFKGGNPAADKLLDFDNSKLIGMTIHEAFPGSVNTEIPDRYKEAAQRGIPWRTEQVEYVDDRVAGAFEVHAFQTSPNKMVASFLDIAERLSTQLELQKAKQRAEFYTDLMAHDINNIHQGILVSLELINSIRNLPEEARNLIQAALDQTQRAIRLIANVRKLSSIEKEKERILYKIDVKNKITEIIPIVKFAFPEKTVMIEVDIPTKECFIKADDLIGDVFYNLCHNSAKFDKSSDVKIDIRTKPCKESDIVEIIVDDYGPGIPDERKNDVLTRKEGKTLGTSGLGLTLVRDIVKQYGGQMWIEDRVANDPSSGTRVVIQMPKYQE